jgi:soluble lytic murein transglycosylase-like protein
MQLMPGTAREMGVSDPLSPDQNIQGGVRYLAWLMQKTGGNITLATAAYNAGPGAVERHRGIPPFEETETYVRRVRILHDRYRKALSGST